MKAAIDRLIERYGEPVEYTPQGGTTLFLTASVQIPASDGIVNDYDLTGFLVFMQAGDVAVKPTKFDRLKVRGSIRGIEEVQEERLNGEIVVYVVRVRG